MSRLVRENHSLIFLQKMYESDKKGQQVMSSKLTKEVILNFINQNPTSKEIDFLLYISMYQDEHGVCRGIYYKDVMEALPCCKQTFYAVKKSLEEKGIIRIERESNMDYDITILGSQYWRNGYLNTRMPVLHTQDFKNLPAGAKMIAIDLIMLIDSNKDYRVWNIGMDKFYERYLNFLPFKIEKKTLREYIRMMKKILVFKKAKTGSKTFKFCIVKQPRKTDRKPYDSKSNDQVWTEQIIRCMCRRNHIDLNERKISDVAKLIPQYRNVAYEHYLSVIELVKWAFDKSLEKLQKNILDSKLIHKYIRNRLYNEPLLF